MVSERLNFWEKFERSPQFFRLRLSARRKPQQNTGNRDKWPERRESSLNGQPVFVGPRMRHDAGPVRPSLRPNRNPRES